MKGAQLREALEGLVMLPDVTHPALTLHLCPCPAKSVGTGTWETVLTQLCGLGDSRARLPTSMPGWIVTLGVVGAGYSRRWGCAAQRDPQGCLAPAMPSSTARGQGDGAQQHPAGPGTSFVPAETGWHSGLAGARPSISHSVCGSPAGTGG